MYLILSMILSYSAFVVSGKSIITGSYGLEIYILFFIVVCLVRVALKKMFSTRAKIDSLELQKLKREMKKGA